MLAPTGAEEQRDRRGAVGVLRTEREAAAIRQDGEHHLQRYRPEAGAGDGRGCPHHREHARWIEGLDLSRPIILSTSGRFTDGIHCLVKAHLHSKEAILAVQFVEDHEPNKWTSTPWPTTSRTSRCTSWEAVELRACSGEYVNLSYGTPHGGAQPCGVRGMA